MMIDMRTAVYTFAIVMLIVLSFLAGKEYNTYIMYTIPLFSDNTIDALLKK